MLHKIHIQTTSRDQMIDITDQVRAVVRQEKVKDGVVTVYCPHTTAGVTINENADPDVVRDLLMRLDEVYPWVHPQYRHTEGNSAAHLKASTMGASQSVPVADGQLVLGHGRGFISVSLTAPGGGPFMSKYKKINVFMNPPTVRERVEFLPSFLF
ncbi:protein of unknown function UPF0047 [Desulfotomaculum nigrificans CO-1-SRB]|uniref:Secondary thiamine-phosphate synthase enzyme n=1 Tax=Desulfotomaculum nigrificans (strain DSM 14880 / VKM B-2319 / CO-1-SRB) TaxID=868595 RepID=F6B698_DESCC|nr:protein of unknown function UPF0047 [Desulfotomaculum nigrificans CO-1-SRB]